MSRGLSANGNNERVDVLPRPASSKALTVELIKTVTQRFDCEIVFKLNLSLRGLTKITGLETCVNLTDLNLSGNSIVKIEGLEALTALKSLTLTCNHITSLDGLPALPKLELLCLQENGISTLHALCLPTLAALSTLTGLYLQNLDRSQPNPVVAVQGYRAAVLAALPGLKNLDGERNPSTSSYMAISAEMAALQLHPPPPWQPALPDVADWLAGVTPEVGVLTAEDILGAPVMVLTEKIGECRSTHDALKLQLSSARRIVQG